MIHKITDTRTQLGQRFITCVCGHVTSGEVYNTIAEQNMAHHIRTAGDEMPKGIAANLAVCDKLDAMSDDEMRAYLDSHDQQATPVADIRKHVAKVRAKMAKALSAMGYQAETTKTGDDQDVHA